MEQSLLRLTTAVLSLLNLPEEASKLTGSLHGISRPGRTAQVSEAQCGGATGLVHLLQMEREAAQGDRLTNGGAGPALTNGNLKPGAARDTTQNGSSQSAPDSATAASQSSRGWQPGEESLRVSSESSGDGIRRGRGQGRGRRARAVDIRGIGGLALSSWN